MTVRMKKTVVDRRCDVAYYFYLGFTRFYILYKEREQSDEIK